MKANFQEVQVAASGKEGLELKVEDAAIHDQISSGLTGPKFKKRTSATLSATD